MTRDYTLETQADAQGKAPVLSVFGGKLTTYRRLSEAALAALKPYFPSMTGSWTRQSTLPGGDIGSASFDDWQEGLSQQYNWLSADITTRLGNAYGSRVHTLLQHCYAVSDLGEHFGAGLYQREVEFLLQQEWARSAEDILWRRSKLGLLLNAGQIEALDQFVRQSVMALASNLSADRAPLRQAG
jgi:glycerol-3-phosphate dehydrogenase